MTKMYGANVSPYKTTAIFLKVSVSSNGVITLAVLSPYIILIAVINSSVLSVYSIKGFLKSVNIRIA